MGPSTGGVFKQLHLVNNGAFSPWSNIYCSGTQGCWLQMLCGSFPGSKVYFLTPVWPCPVFFAGFTFLSTEGPPRSSATSLLCAKRRKLLKNSSGNWFQMPSWARAKGCPADQSGSAQESSVRRQGRGEAGKDQSQPPLASTTFPGSHQRAHLHFPTLRLLNWVRNGKRTFLLLKKRRKTQELESHRATF